MVRSRIVSIIGWTAVMAVLAVPARADETIRISGTGGALGGARLLGEAFMKKHRDVQVEVLKSTGSTGGIKAVKAGKLDIALSSRPLKQEEKGPGIVEEAYAKTPFIFATRSPGPVEGLSLAEIEDIYAGRKTAWPDGSRIFLVLRPKSDYITAFLENISPGMKVASDAALNKVGIFVGMTDQDSADQIEITSGSFGTTTLALVSSEKRRIRPIAVEGISPVDRSGANAKYPYAVTFHLVYAKQGMRGITKEFLRFIRSREGERILRRSGHIPSSRTEGNP